LERLDKALLFLPSYTEATIKALEESGGHQSKAAEILNIGPPAVSQRIQAIRRAAAEINDNATLKQLDKALAKTLPSFTEATLKTLEESSGNRSKATEVLNINSKTVSQRIQAIRRSATKIGDNTTLERLDKALLFLPSYTEATIKALEESGGHQSKAARILDTSRQVISQRIQAIRRFATEIGDNVTLERLDKALAYSTEATLKALEESGGHQSKAAEILNIIQQTVSHRIQAIKEAATERGDMVTLERIDKALAKT
ncbi:MAG: helix-turn-helix domain-containing protein, partial [Candidatus Omnitrophota bacterium]|nr:helix-turn-helix domain-containing protein [Candidatus Omnitrophota bacterium]